MPNIEWVKNRAKLARVEKERDNPSTLQEGDVLLVLHMNEVELLTDLLYDSLGDSEKSVDQKRTALNLIKHIEG